jgi:hypothetical protein
MEKLLECVVLSSLASTLLLRSQVSVLLEFCCMWSVIFSLIALKLFSLALPFSVLTVVCQLLEGTPSLSRETLQFTEKKVRCSGTCLQSQLLRRLKKKYHLSPGIWAT